MSDKHLLHRLPWWSFILLAIVVYCSLKYGLAGFTPEHALLRQLIEAAPVFAPILTIPLLLYAAKRLYDDTDPEEKDSR